MNDTDRRIKFLNQAELAKRWLISQRTLERWRWERRGPPYVKLYNKRVLYNLEVIEEIEQQSEKGVEQ